MAFTLYARDSPEKTSSLGRKIKSLFTKKERPPSSSSRLATGLNEFDASSITTSTPKITTVNGKRLKGMAHIFQIRNHHGYRLKDFQNRISAYIPWRGFTEDIDRRFTKFDSPDTEKLNFVHSKLGDLASPIDENGEYYIFAVKQYLKISK